MFDRKRASLVAVFTVMLLLVLGFLAWDTPLLRAIRGVSVFVISNDSGREIRDVKIVLRTREDLHIVRDYRSISPGAEEKTPVHTRDLYVESIQFVLDGKEFTHSGQGFGLPGEIIVRSVRDDGQINWYCR